MTYKFNNTTVRIPEQEIKKYIEKLDLTEEEAVELWLEDNGYQTNEEQSLLDDKAKQVKISHEAIDIEKKPKKTEKKPRVFNASNEKKQIFHTIYSALLEFGGNNVTVLKENKSFEVKIGEKSFCVDIIEHKNKKK